jgi:hypothetical protein
MLYAVVHTGDSSSACVWTPCRRSRTSTAVSQRVCCAVSSCLCVFLTIFQAFRHLAKQANTLLLPANAGDPASMVAQALGVYKTVSTQQQRQQLPGGGDDDGGSSGGGRGSASSAPAMAGLGGGGGGGGSSSGGAGGGRKFTSSAAGLSSSSSGGGSSSVRDAAAAAGVGAGALGGAAMTSSWLPDSPVFSLRSVLDE